MDTLINKDTILQFVELLPTLQTQLTTITKQIREYLQFLHQSDFVIDQNDSDENKLNKTKNVLYSLQQVIEKRKSIYKNGNDILQIADTIKEQVSGIIQNCFFDNQQIEMISNVLIDEIVTLEKRIYTKEMERMSKEMKEKEEKQKANEEEWNSKKSNIEENNNINFNNNTNQIPQRNEINQYNPYNRIEFSIQMNPNETIRNQERQYLQSIITEPEIQQIERWTEMRFNRILFDSQIDEWNTSVVFQEKIFNQDKIVIIIEDTEGNIFGSFISERINRKGITWKNGIKDPKAFVFSIRSNGRMKEMKKFGIKETEKAFLLNNSDDEMNWIFLIGNGSDIILWNQKYKTSSQCIQSTSFDYENNQYALRGNNLTFSPKRFICIQLF